MTMQNKQDAGMKTGQTKDTEMADGRGTKQANQGNPNQGTGVKDRQDQMGGGHKQAGRADPQQGDGRK